MKKLINILALILSFSALGYGQTTAIPDTAFEQRLIALGIDSDGLVNGQILNSDAAGVTNLNLSYSNISDLTGIDAFDDLGFLNCNANQLSSLDVSSNSDLITLDCSHNQLDSLDLSNNTRLVILDCDHSQLTSLTVTGLIDLKSLDCSDNQLVSLDVSTNVALVTLKCHENLLTNLTVNGAVALETLDCWKNGLVSLDVSTNIALVTLECYFNQLTNLTVNGAVALESINCWRNQLVSLDVSANVALVTLKCHENLLTNLTVNGAVALETLDCNANQLVSLDVSTNVALITIRCHYNQLTSLTVNGSTSLERFYCSNNQLSSLDVSANLALIFLDCSDNSLTNLDVSANLNLGVLYCTNTQLSSLDVTNNLLLEVLYCNDNQLSSLDLRRNIALFRLRCFNNNLGTLDISNLVALTNLYCQNNLPFLSICVADTTMNNSNWVKDPTARYSEGCFPKAIEGRITIDANSNCISDSLEQGLSNIMLQFRSNRDTNYFVSYDTLGNYVAYLDTGVYTISVVMPNAYWQVCPSSQQVTVDTNYSIQALDWSLQPLVTCPALEVDIAAPFLRMTGGGSAYTISYCNNGTITAQNAYVEVDLDPALNILGTGLPIANQAGTIYTFNIGDIAVGECGSFSLQVLVDTTALFQQTHCTEARIYPDSFCLPVWTGPIATADASCQNDSVYFRVANIGVAMLQPQQYFVYEDNIVMRSGTVQLGANQFVNIIEEALVGKTYRIEVEQMTNFPSVLGDSVAMASIEGCNPFTDGSFNTGFITQLSNGNSRPVVAVDCQQNVASYDPNDKAAQPAGYDTAHYIYKNTAIDYKIRFQNTG
ncbi:MAG: hypothetical protein GY810_30570, partial [Aureispira sp.]|nr:hypothetical protein [Aureispira sp.]